MESEISSIKTHFDKDLDSALDVSEKLLHFPRINFVTSELSQIRKINNSSQSIVHFYTLN